MKVFVTGASGFLGKRLVHRLKRAGHEVGANGRSVESRKALTQDGVTHVVDGSLENIDAWADRLAGFDVLVHAAAPIEMWGPWPRFEAQIVDATAKLIDAASRHGVKRFIYISSESVWQDVDPLVGIDETRPPAAQPNSFYGRAKKLAEQAVFGYGGPIERIVLRPTFIWGPDSPACAAILQQAGNGGFVWIDGGRAPFEAVHVDNVAEAILLAVDHGRSGEAYAVTDGRDYTVRGFFSAMFERAGLPVPRLSLPGWLLRPAAALMEKLWRICGIASKPPLTRFELAFVSQPRRYRIDKIRRDLGYRPLA
ncbi:MAG: hypothetical protein A3I66_18015 [Burkholderiales bacterium RIFCSPLOWO2_02_FULL_57_36]|nr:MAG: hypothetical protein A3I66_18015 [Burkholderiales bacterium RIFCSPLOWO2_02_FULL_57_36]